MRKDRIIGIKFSPGGLTGLQITYKKGEAKSNIEYENEITKKVRWPIQGALLVHLNDLRVWLPSMSIDLYGSLDIISTGWILKGETVIITGLMKGDLGDGLVHSGFSSLPIGPSADVYDSLVRHINETEELIRDYMTTKAQLNIRQMVMDFAKEGKIKDGTKTLAELGGMSESELLEYCQSTIEHAGGSVIGLEIESKESQAA